MLARLLKTVSFPAVLAVIDCATTGQFKDDETTAVQVCSQRRSKGQGSLAAQVFP